MKLYSYFRSSASYRVRIALNLKGIPYEQAPVHLLAGEQFAPEFRKLSPDALVPALVEEAGSGPALLRQSLAIIEYLDEVYRHPPLLPPDPLDRAWVRSVALSIACEIHPLNNLRVLRYLVRTLQASEEGKNAWYRHWCEQGLAAVECILANDGRTGNFCFGDTPTLADCCLVPQVANAQRMQCNLDSMPNILRINQACLAMEAFAAAAPERQPDAK